MSAKTLHVTNGDSVIYLWKKAALLGTHLAWKDVLHEGPVPAGLTLEELSRVRAGYIASRNYANPIKAHRDFEKRDAVIRSAGDFEEIVLWFEHDLYDQLHVLQILETLRELRIGAGRVQLVQSDHYLGMLSADELMALYPKRKFVTTATAEGAKRAWDAFAADRPAALAEAARQKYPGLPYLQDALRRVCEEYPDSASGLSRSQKNLLEACAQGARGREEIFRRSQTREEAAFLGDVAAYAMLDDLCAEPSPLLCIQGSEYDTTVLGRRVLAGDADWLEVQGPERWIGGVRLGAGSTWRWNEREETLVERMGQGREAEH